MRTIDRDDFARVADEDNYYKSEERWDLYEAVAQLVRQTGAASSLELGPYKLPITDGDTLDKNEELSPTYLHDATVTPWPITQRYDLFIGLQVWEHLKGRQVDAFTEVTRLADQAILSFPFRWECPRNPSHHAITEATISCWTGNLTPASDPIVIPSASNHRRIIYHFDFRTGSC